MAPAEPTIGVEVVYCPAPGVVDRVLLRLPAGATVADALHASGLAERHGLTGPLQAGVWCRARESSSPLRDHDRVELYRPLVVDPKEARRLRYRKDRAR
jgi:uncharacterized protein